MTMPEEIKAQVEDAATESIKKEFERRKMFYNNDTLQHRVAYHAGAQFMFDLCAKREAEPIAMITHEPFMVENITIDQHYRFTKQIKELQAQLQIAREALEYYSNEMEWRQHFFKIPMAHTNPSKEPLDFKGYAVAKEVLAKLTKNEEG